MLKLRSVFELVTRQTAIQLARPRFPTWLVPVVEPGGDSGHGTWGERLRSMIDNTARIDRIVQGSGLVHMLRLQILDAFGRDPGDMSPPELDCWYVLFVAEVDGHYTDLLDRMCALDADFVREMISCSTAGDPAWIAPTEPARLPPFFRRFMWRCLIKTRVPYFAYQSSLAEVRRALQLQHEFTRCAIQWQYHNGPRPQDWTDFCDDNRQLLW